jgi:hypothetical protein
MTPAGQGTAQLNLKGMAGIVVDDDRQLHSPETMWELKVRFVSSLTR